MKWMLWVLMCGCSAAFAADCEGLFVSRPMSQLASKLMRSELGKDVTYRIRKRGIPATVREIAQLQEALTQLHYPVRLRLVNSDRDEQGDFHDFEISGLGRDVGKALFELASEETEWMVFQPSEEKIAPSGPPPPSPLLHSIARVPVRNLRLPVRTQHALTSENIYFVGDLITRSEPELVRLKYLGRRGLREVQTALAERGLHLGMELMSWPPEEMDQVEIQFVTAHWPTVRLEEWSVRTMELNESLLGSPQKVLTLEHPVAVLTYASEPRVAFINCGYFEHAGTLAVDRELSLASKRPAEKRTKTSKATIKAWQQNLATFRRVGMSEITGQAGLERLLEAAESGTPLIVEPLNSAPSDHVVVLPLNPLEGG